MIVNYKNKYKKYKQKYLNLKGVGVNGGSYHDILPNIREIIGTYLEPGKLSINKLSIKLSKLLELDSY